MAAPDLKIVTLNDSNFRDPVATLREIADDVEAGKYGPVGCIGLALLGDEFHVFGMGSDSEGPAIAIMFQAAILRLSAAIEQHGK